MRSYNPTIGFSLVVHVTKNTHTHTLWKILENPTFAPENVGLWSQNSKHDSKTPQNSDKAASNLKYINHMRKHGLNFNSASISPIHRENGRKFLESKLCCWKRPKINSKTAKISRKWIFALSSISSVFLGFPRLSSAFLGFPRFSPRLSSAFLGFPRLSSVFLGFKFADSVRFSPILSVFAFFPLERQKSLLRWLFWGDFRWSSGFCQHFRNCFDAFQVNGDDFQFCFHSRGDFSLCGLAVWRSAPCLSLIRRHL